MKTFTFLFLILLSLEGLAFERQDAEQLLNQRNFSLQNFENQGERLLLGEVTGGGKIINLEDVSAIFLEQQVILKKEIESFHTQEETSTLSAVDTFRANGLYFSKEEIKAILLKQ